MILALSRTHHGAQNAVVHELDDGTTLVWELLDAEPDDALLAAPVDVGPGWLMRHDRIDFPPGGIAYRHTHPGPGIRYLLLRLAPDRLRRRDPRLRAGGAMVRERPRAGARDRVRDGGDARSSASCCCPAEWAGKRTIRYVDPADEDRPKLQRPTVYGEYPIAF